MVLNVDGIILLWHVRPVLLGSTPAICKPHVSCLDPVPVGSYGFRPDIPGGVRGCVARPARACGKKRGTPREPVGARPGGTVSCGAAARYSPTPSRVQYHRRAGP